MNPPPSQTVGDTELIEPKAAQSGIGVGLIVFFYVLLFGAMFYFDYQGGWAGSQVYAPYRSEEQLLAFQPVPTEGPDLRHGKEVYDKVCGLCHGPDGMGKPNQFPPFVGSEWVLGSPNRLIRIPILGLNGPIKVKDTQWNLSMPAQGASMSDEDLAAVLCYIRMSWGNKGTEIKAEEVKAVRAAIGARAQPWTSVELLAVPEK